MGFTHELGTIPTLGWCTTCLREGRKAPAFETAENEKETHAKMAIAIADGSGVCQFHVSGS